MIKRYQHSAIEMLWNTTHRAEIWKNLEIWVAEAWNQKGLISLAELEVIQKTKVNLEEWAIREQKTHHEVAAFVDMLAAQCGLAGRWIHYGLTSNDVIDSTNHYLLRETNKVFLQLLDSLLAVLKTRAFTEKETLMIGRTHGMFAEPISAGYKFALWYSECKRHQAALKNALDYIGVLKIAGPTGMHPDIPLGISEYVAQKMKMRVDYAANQLIIRDRLIAIVQTWTNLVITLEKIAIEIRNLHRSELQEFQEDFVSGQKGSSAMPHKQNPWLSENVCGLSRIFRNLAHSIEFTNLTWHERDLTNSAIERFSLPNLAHLLATMLTRITKIIEGLIVNRVVIKNNLEKAKTAAFSHRVLLYLIRRHKMSREKAYFLVQKNVQLVGARKVTFQKLMEAEPVLKNNLDNEWKTLWLWKSFLQNVDNLYNHIFPKEKK